MLHVYFCPHTVCTLQTFLSQVIHLGDPEFLVVTKRAGKRGVNLGRHFLRGGLLDFRFPCCNVGKRSWGHRVNDTEDQVVR